MYNYNFLLKIKYKKSLILYIILIFIILGLIISIKCEIYSSYKTYGIYNRENIVLNIPIDKTYILENSYLKINNKKYNFILNNQNTLNVIDNQNYQEYYLQIENLNLKENEIVLINIYYDKERIIKKILNVIF